MDYQPLTSALAGISGALLIGLLVWLAVTAIFLPLFVWGIYRSNRRIRIEMERQTDLLESIDYSLKKSNGDIEKIDF